jgi:hypothetical protein
MVTLTLPQLVAGRDLADDAVAGLGELHGEQVVVDARRLVSGTASFAGQLVHRILSDGGAGTLAVIGGPDDFNHYVSDAARDLQVSDRLTISDSTAA